MEIVINGDVNVYTRGSDEVDVSNHKIRTSTAVSSAKRKVKSADKVCQCCGDIGVNGHLEVHHIFPLAKYQDLAADEKNLITLCQRCHRKYHEQYKGSEGATTFAKFMRDNGG